MIRKNKVNFHYINCYYEGEQERLYVEKVVKLLHENNDTHIKIVGHYRSYGSIIKNSDYDCALFFDYDNNKEEFVKNMATCFKFDEVQKRKKKAMQLKCYHAYSNMSFDLWLLLHKDNYNRPVNCANDYIHDVRRVYGLAKDADIKNKEVINTIINQISLQDVIDAIHRAEKIEEYNQNNKKLNCVNQVRWYDNPDLTVYIFIKHLLEECNITV